MRPAFRLSVRRQRRVRVRTPATAEAPEEGGEPEQRDRQQIEQLGDPVPGVGEDDHVFSAAESSQSPRQVKQTITTSMTSWEREAARGWP